ncbi:hypothetical protein JCM8208_002130 [Rhodotorula glutinis]
MATVPPSTPFSGHQHTPYSSRAMHSTAPVDHSAPYRLPPPSSSPSTTNLAPSSRGASSAPHAAPSSDAHATLIASSKSAMLGTWDNPLIPVRRRRTTPAELNVLEREFGTNPRPDPLERARIAERLGMTARAVQVWYQNRRQKQKKELACSSSSVASSGSDPRDLDGVLLSFSSSPLPSPAMPLHASAVASTPGELPKTVVLPALQGPCTASPAPSSSASSSSGSNKENSYFPTTVPSSATMPASSCGRVTAPALLAASANASAASAPSQQLQQPGAPPYAYTYSASALHAAPTGVEAALSADGGAPGVYLHRASTASIIAAKKHVRKRPQGSHAPLARVPSLPHAFVFPPSPVKPAAAATRLAAVRKASLNDVADRQQKKAVESAGLFAHAQGDTVAAAAQRRRSSTPVGGAPAPAPVPAPAAAAPTSSTPFAADELAPFAQAQPSSLVALTPVSKAKAKDELLRHMESDPPSASSPAPLTRRRMMAHEASMGDAGMLGEDDDDEHDDEDRGVFSRLDLPHRPAATRSLSASYTDSTGFPHAAPAMGRTASLGSFPSHAHSRTSTSASVPIEHGDAHSALAASSRAASAAAGSARTCAVEALGRKRARFIEHHAAVLPVRAPSSRPSTSAYASQGRQFGGLSFEFSTAAAARKEAGQRKRRRTSGESATSQGSASTATATTAATTTTSTTAEDDSFGDLSFSSTSTATSVDSLMTVADGNEAGYSWPSLPAAAKQASSVEAHGNKTPEDEQRECAELLLGLGGFF